MSQEGKKPPLDAIAPIEIDLPTEVTRNEDEEVTDPSIVLPVKSAPAAATASFPGLEPSEALEPTSATPKPGAISRPAPIAIAAPVPTPPPQPKRVTPTLSVATAQPKTQPQPQPRPQPALQAMPQPPSPSQPQLAIPPETVSPLPPRMPEMGPLEALMKDAAITEIMVNDLRNVMVEREGKMMFSGFTFKSLDELNRLVRSMLDATGRVLGPDSPYVDLSLADGSRVNIVGPPLTINGPCITIRKFPRKRPSIDDLMNNGTLDRRIAYFLNVCVMGRRNILISGGTDTGKTTLLNALAQFIPKPERVVSIEDTAELAINHPNSVRLQTKPLSPTAPPISSRELVANALRMRPDRIIVGECRKGEAFDMLQAMNTGHLGSMTTIHANSARDSLARLETLCMLAGVDLPVVAFRRQIASALDLVIHLKRFRSGKRRIVSISEVTGMEGEVITMQDIFLFGIPQKSGTDEAGVFKCTGFIPTFLEELREQGIDFPEGFFA